MIPLAYITEWKAHQAPWPLEAHVEQDLILSRIVVEIYSDPSFSRNISLFGVEPRFTSCF